eukprot:4349979-Amphidinium_carterae.3
MRARIVGKEYSAPNNGRDIFKNVSTGSLKVLAGGGTTNKMLVLDDDEERISIHRLLYFDLPQGDDPARRTR